VKLLTGVHQDRLSAQFSEGRLSHSASVPKTLTGGSVGVQ
jgi:hypothetical protein